MGGGEGLGVFFFFDLEGPNLGDITSPLKGVHWGPWGPGGHGLGGCQASDGETRILTFSTFSIFF